MVKEIDSVTLESRLTASNQVRLIDIRNATELASGVLPKSEHLPMHLIPLKLNELSPDQEIVLYCHSGARSYNACMYLMQNGFDNVRNLNGGILGWAKNGYEIVAPA